MAFGDRQRQRVRERVDKAIKSHLESGEQVERVVMGLHSRAPILALELVSPLLILFAVPYYVALTDRRLVFLRYSRLSVRRIWFGFAEQLPLRAEARLRRGLVNYSLRLALPDRTVRLYVNRIFREDAQAIADAVSGGGAAA
jgi:hypothetical protein